MRFALVALIPVLGCYAAHELSDGEPTEHDTSFVGDWAVLSAFGWALLPTETVYRLHDDGEVEVIRHTEGTYFEGEAGQWFYFEDSRDEPLVCEFGDRWWSVGTELHIESDCSDGVTRALLLQEFVAGGNAGRVELGVVGPRGAVGFWVHDAIPGSIRRCADDC